MLFFFNSIYRNKKSWPIQPALAPFPVSSPASCHKALHGEEPGNVASLPRVKAISIGL